MNVKLSKSQARNLALLSEIGGTWTYTYQCRICRPDRRSLYHIRQGYGTSSSQSASHKGFHRVAMDSLVKKGLVKRTASKFETNWPAHEADWRYYIGSVAGERFTYTIVAP